MRIEHIAIWVKDLENCKDFYCKYFNGQSNDIYINKTKGFSSYFIEFESGCRLELMHQNDHYVRADPNKSLGIIHMAFQLASPRAVDKMLQKLAEDGIPILGEARTTGDGYYEGVVADPEGNIIELVG